MSRRRNPRLPSPRPFRASLAQLVEDLRAEGGEVVGDIEVGDLLITSYGGEELTRPVPLRITPAEFDAAMRQRPAATSSPWGPQDDPEQAAYRLLLIALDEDLTAAEPPLELTFDGHGLVTVWPAGDERNAPG